MYEQPFRILDREADMRQAYAEFPRRMGNGIMTELLPTRQAADLRRAVIDYVTTAISLADPSVASALDAFLTDERLRDLPWPLSAHPSAFRRRRGAAAARELVPSLPEWFEPYAHQAAAFARLSTSPRRRRAG